MKRRTFFKTAGAAAGALLFPAFLARAASGNGVGALTFRLQVATSPGFEASSLVLDQSGLAEPKFSLQGLRSGQTYYWRANASDDVLTSEWSEVFHFQASTSVRSEPAEQPYTFELGANYPNPFNPSTTIPFTLPEAGHVSLRVYNQLGQEVAQLVNDYRTAGQHEVTWDASRFASGTYLCVLKAGAHTQTRRMLLVK